MSLNSSFPKIWALGHKNTASIFKGPVEITEKIDGSQFGWGKIDEKLICRSKNRILSLDAPDILFRPAVEHIKKVQDRIPNNSFFWGETLASPKHNTIKYSNTPKNNIALFGACLTLKDKLIFHYDELENIAILFDIDIVPLLFYGEMQFSTEVFDKFLETDSYLGGSTIEGVVVKNYTQDLMVGGYYIPLVAGKVVSEKFKERHAVNSKHKAGSLEIMLSHLKTDAAWDKAEQHVRENGVDTEDVSAIGPIIEEIKRDVWEENYDEIIEILIKKNKKEVDKILIRGFPEYFKKKLTTSFMK